MPSYLAWIDDAVFGPFSVQDLIGVRGFKLETLVSPDSCEGTRPEDWHPADRVPEISSEVARAIKSDPNGSLAESMQSATGLSQAAIAVVSLQMEFELGEKTGNNLKKIDENEAQARDLLAKFRLLEKDLQDASPRALETSLRRTQASAALRMDLRSQIKTLGRMIDRIAIFKTEFQERQRIEAEKQSGIPATALAPPQESSLEYTLLGRIAALTGKWTFIIVSAALSLRYLSWRAFQTLNYSSDIHFLVSVSLLMAEIYGFVSAQLFFIQVIAPKPVKPVALEGEPPNVDLFITIYNEPLEILENTLVACKALDYPAARLRVHVLDDGTRPQVKRMAGNFGFNYLTRPDHIHAKAGNLNAALPRTDAEFIMILDVDHIPVRSYLKETLGFFKDSKVAFVQTPHHFYNPDCYQKNLRLEGHVVNEQDLFFQVIEPGKNDANAVIFAGSSAVFRRVALNEIGGFKTECAIEDLHTGMELQARGWKGVYYKKILSAALSPEDFSGYLIQRGRWARGGVQLFFLDNPLFKKGLSPRQRLFYFASLLYFFHGWVRLVYLFAPLSFLLFNCNPIVCSIGTLLWYFIPHYAASHLVFSQFSRENRNPFWSDVYEAASSFSLSWTAFATLFRPDFLVFKVTPKGLDIKKERFKWRTMLPHIVLCGLLVAGIIRTVYHFETGNIALDSFGLSCLWAAFNFILIACAIAVTRERPHNRRHIRFKRSFPVTLYAGGKEFAGRTVDISLSGAMITLSECLDLPKDAMLHVVGDGDTLITACEVRHNRWMGKKGARVGVDFNKISDVQTHQIVRLLFSAPGSWENVYRPLRGSARSFKNILVSGLKQAQGPSASNAPLFGEAVLIYQSAKIRVRLEDLSPSHAVARLPRGLTPSGRMTLWIPGQKADKDRFVSVQNAQFLGGADGQWSFLLAFANKKEGSQKLVALAPGEKS